MQNLGTIFMNLVAIVGAAVIGAFVCGFIFQLSVRFSTRRYPPHVLLQAVRLLGGLACGLLVYLLVSSGGGGFGLGTGGLGLGGLGQGKSTATGTGTGKGTGSEATEKNPPPPRDQSRRRATRPSRWRCSRSRCLAANATSPIAIASTSSKGDKEPKTLTELVAIIQEKQKQNGFPGIEIVIYNTGSVANTHPAVKDLKDRAQGLGLAVKTTILDQDAPPLP